MDARIKSGHDDQQGWSDRTRCSNSPMRAPHILIGSAARSFSNIRLFRPVRSKTGAAKDEPLPGLLSRPST
jgi:hypothetical protein